MMNNKRLCISISCATVVLAAASAAAAQEGTPKKTDENPVTAAPLVFLAPAQWVGAKVLSRGGGDAADREDEKGAGASDGSAAAASAPFGVLRDVVLDNSTGQITFAVIEMDDVQRAVPFSELQWDAERKTLSIAMTKAAAEKAAPLFDPKQLSRLHGHEAKDDGADGDGKAEHEARALRFLLASKVGEATVKGTDGDFATASGLMIELLSDMPAFLRVEKGGVLGVGAEEYVIPWRAIQVEKGTTPSGCTCKVGIALEQLRAAPKVGATDDAKVENPTFRDKLYAYFRITPPRYERLVQNEGH